MGFHVKSGRSGRGVTLASRYPGLYYPGRMYLRICSLFAMSRPRSDLRELTRPRCDNGESRCLAPFPMVCDESVFLPGMSRCGNTDKVDQDVEPRRFGQVVREPSVHALRHVVVCCITAERDTLQTKRVPAIAHDL
jgi:hypothetical protein